jgi:hypothetical protein
MQMAISTAKLYNLSKRIYNFKLGSLLRSNATANKSEEMTRCHAEPFAFFMLNEVKNQGFVLTTDAAKRLVIVCLKFLNIKLPSLCKK